MKNPYERPARPWDLFNKNLKKVETTISQERLSICKECPRLNAISNICLECGCVMTLKTKLPNASCPIGKWSIIASNDMYKKEI